MLLVHDEPAGVEHLVREVAFANVDRAFGFVVPTPTQPGVFKVDDLGWGALESTFPLERSKGGGAPGGFGSGHGRGGGGVAVLEAKRVGSFAAFVLRATDDKAMKGWLERNRFTTTPASEAWLARYVRLGFYFVALRFEPALFAEKTRGAGQGRSNAETLRITFETPVPFYPYVEPDRDDIANDRLVALWFVTNGKAKIPVSLASEGERRSYVRPWREGLRSPNWTAERLGGIVGEKAWKDLAPRGSAPLLVQVFEDQKRNRKGFGDVLLAPEEPVELDAAAVARRKALLPLLDPALETP